MGISACYYAISPELLAAFQESLPENLDEMLSDWPKQASLDKNWKPIYSVLTGAITDRDNHPLSKAIAGGKLLDKALGYYYPDAVGARNGLLDHYYYLEAAEVREIAQALSEVDEQAFRDKYNEAVKLNPDGKLYYLSSEDLASFANSWPPLSEYAERYYQSSRSIEVEELLPAYLDLMEFYQKAAQRGKAVLVMME